MVELECDDSIVEDVVDSEDVLVVGHGVEIESLFVDWINAAVAAAVVLEENIFMI